MYLLIGILVVICLFFALRYYFVNLEIKRLHQKINELSQDACYGKRLYLEENNRVLSDAIEAINRMVDSYENKLRRVDEMERNIRQSISGISHDLRTPLTSLAGYLQLLSKESLPDKQKEYLDTILTSVRTLQDLTENFYELSCLDLEKTTFSMQSLNFEHIVCECLLSFYENFAQRCIELDIKDATVPPVVMADIVALKRVLYNIIQNLLRYANGTISVTFSEEEYCFTVMIGNETTATMPDEVNRVFERFYTADPSRKGQSMGLGLYISRKLIEGMGGTITAHKDNTKFYITIKLQKSSEIN